MRLMLINSGRVIAAAGGIEKVFCAMANEMAARGHAITAVCHEDKEGRPFFPLDERVAFHNLGLGFKRRHILFRFQRELVRACRSRSVFEGWNHKNKLAFLGPALRELAGFARPEVIVTSQFEATALVKGLGLAAPVITMHHFDPAGLTGLSPPNASAMRQSERVQVLLPSFVGPVETLGAGRVVVIPNIVPQFGEFKPRPARADGGTIITIGRADLRQKRPQLLLEAFAQLKDRFPRWRLEHWGDTGGVWRKGYGHLQKLSADLGLAGRVFFRGLFQEAGPVLQAADIFAFPSAFEGWGLTLTEALSAGLPAVGFRACPGVNELIRDGENGFLCDEGSAALAEALARLMADAPLRERLGRNGHEDMKAYRAERVWALWEDLFRDTANSPG